MSKGTKASYRPGSTGHYSTGTNSSVSTSYTKSRRPLSRSSSTGHMTYNNYVPYNERGQIFTNVTNSFQRIKADKTHFWKKRRSSVDDGNDKNQKSKNDENTPKKGSNDKDDDDKQKVKLNPQGSRTNRPSSFIRFKYAEHFHQRSLPNQSALERVIPECLRQFPQYTMLPMRQSCVHNPWASVTYIRGHSVNSFALPHPKNEKKGNERIIEDLSRTKEAKVDDSDQAADLEEKSSVDPDPERNGTATFVYEEPSSKPTAYEVELYEEDFDEDNDGRNDSDDSDKESVKSEAGSVKSEPDSVESGAGSVKSEADSVKSESFTPKDKKDLKAALSALSSSSSSINSEVNQSLSDHELDPPDDMIAMQAKRPQRKALIKR